MVGEEHVSGLIRKWVEANCRIAQPEKIELEEDTDLMATGILDSMGFIELLVHVESLTGSKIDLSDLDPKEFTSIKGLARSAVSRNMSASAVGEIS
jgi:acyl carrier protein